MQRLGVKRNCVIFDNASWVRLSLVDRLGLNQPIASTYVRHSPQ